MSKWTAVLAVIRVNTVNEFFEIRGSNDQKRSEKLKLEEIIGPVWTGYYPTNRKKCKLPCGSEGSLKYFITQPTRRHRSQYMSDETYDTLITFHGNLRDFGNDEIETILLPWWERLIQQLKKEDLIRSYTFSYSDQSGQTHSIANVW